MLIAHVKDLKQKNLKGPKKINEWKLKGVNVKLIL